MQGFKLVIGYWLVNFVKYGTFVNFVAVVFLSFSRNLVAASVLSLLFCHSVGISKLRN